MDIDQILANQQIQVSSISSVENIRKLQLQNISYIVTGSVDAMGSDYAVTLRILDVSTGQFGHSANAFMSSVSQDLYNGVTQLTNAFAAGMTGQGGQVTQASRQSGGVYQIGDRGPAGGWVFYDKGIISNGWRYLEAAPLEAEFTAQWGAYERNMGGTSTATGTGKRNTEVIVEYLRRISENGKAAQLCDSFSMDGYDDWFLPSKDELNLMYQNLKQRGLGGFSNERYWSSSENSNDRAWDQRFSDGGQYNHARTLTRTVRAIRAF
jgi:hypothetical protein